MSLCPAPLPGSLAHLLPAVDCNPQWGSGHQRVLTELLSGWTSAEFLVFKCVLEMLRQVDYCEFGVSLGDRERSYLQKEGREGGRGGRRARAGGGGKTQGY